MKIIKTITIASVVSISMVSFVFASSVRVRGYTRKSTGTYVYPSRRTSPNHTKIDNYSTKGNYNPYTGKVGHSKAY